MDFETFGLTCVCNLVTLLILYTIWILPSLKKVVFELPSTLSPYIDGKIDEVKTYVAKSSASFQRTVNSAIRNLDLEDVDLSTEDGIEEAKAKIAKSYGWDVAVQSISQLISKSIEGRKAQEEQTKGELSKW